MSYWQLKYMENGFQITKEVDESDEKRVDELFYDAKKLAFLGRQYVLWNMEDRREK